MWCGKAAARPGQGRAASATRSGWTPAWAYLQHSPHQALFSALFGGKASIPQKCTVHHDESMLWMSTRGGTKILTLHTLSLASLPAFLPHLKTLFWFLLCSLFPATPWVSITCAVIASPCISLNFHCDPGKAFPTFKVVPESRGKEEGGVFRVGHVGLPFLG